MMKCANTIIQNGIVKHEHGRPTRIAVQEREVREHDEERDLQHPQHEGHAVVRQGERLERASSTPKRRAAPRPTRNAAKSKGCEWRNPTFMATHE
jgi:hypothetical protein